MQCYAVFDRMMFIEVKNSIKTVGNIRWTCAQQVVHVLSDAGGHDAVSQSVALKGNFKWCVDEYRFYACCSMFASKGEK